MPTDLTNRPGWKALVESNPAYKKLWLAGAFPPRISRDTPYLTNRRKGVGDHMIDVTAELKLAMKHGCSCKSLAAKMNRLGPEGCRRERASLVNELKKNAREYTWGDVAKAAAMALKTGLVWRINPLDPYGSMLDEAIRRTEADLQSKELA